VSAEKLSISLDSELVTAVRAAAAKAEVSVSTWLSQAAEARVRQSHLGAALEACSAEHGSLSEDEVRELIAAARQRSILILPKRAAR
jgi:2-phospho-L-lactate guanylyltransferase (CobY/MobA/RfbA family)